MLPVALNPDPGHPAARRGADPALFVEELDRHLSAALSRSTHRGYPPGQEVADLLGAALRRKIEASEVAALWMAREFDLELKLGFARLCGDEARHYRALVDRLRVLRDDAARLDPLARGHSPLFRYLRGLETSSERLAAGGLACQGIARAGNAACADLCEARGDGETARLYREVIDPDEASHVEFARRHLVRFAVTVEDQERARRALARALQLSQEPSAAAGGRAPAVRAPAVRVPG